MADKIFLKTEQKIQRTKINLKRYEADESKRNYVGKCISLRKQKRKDIYENSENISAKNNFPPTNSTSPSTKISWIVQLNNTTKTDIVTTQTFNHNQTPSTSWIGTTQSNDDVEHPDVAENNLSVMEYKQSFEMTISQHFSWVHFSRDTIIFSIAGFKIINNSSFQVHFAIMGHKQVRQDSSNKELRECVKLYKSLQVLQII